MNSDKTSMELVREIFREEALLIENLATSYELSDDLIWALCRNLDLIRLRFLAKLIQDNQSQRARLNPRPSPHPAVQELLRKLKE
jgi:hypothetical protein